MDDPQIQHLRERIQGLERAVGEVQQTVARLDAAVAEIRATFPPSLTIDLDARARSLPPPPPPPFQSTALSTAERVEVFCPNCRGGNPPDAGRCMWCGNPLPAAQGAPAFLYPGSASTAIPAHVAARGTLPAGAEPLGSPALAAASASASGSSATPRRNFDIARSGEFWLNKIGIVLFLFGIGFLFKYSVDQGWLTEPVRVGIGLALGGALLAVGLRLGRERQQLKQVLLGGSIATFYVTGFAAYQLFHLVGYEIAFGFMVAVTLLAFFLAIHQAAVVLSIVGVAGGLATPFVLYSGQGGLAGLIGYTCIILTGACALYFVRGWRSLLWTAFVGGWWVFIIGYTNTSFTRQLPVADQWALQFGVIFALLAFWAMPVVREALSTTDPHRWPRPSLDFLSDASINSMVNAHVHALVVSTPLLALWLSRQVWGPAVSSEIWGGITVAGALVYAAVWWGLRTRVERLAYTHLVMAVLLLTLALLQLLRGDVLVFALAVEGAALLAASRRLPTSRSLQGLDLLGHLVFAGVALLMATRLATGREGDLSVLNAKAITDLAVIALALVSSFVIGSERIALVYRLSAHAAFLLLLWRELIVLPGGNGYVFLAWGLYALALLVASRRMPASLTRQGQEVLGHLVFAAVAVLLAFRLATGHEGEVGLLNAKALTDLVVIALALAASFVIGQGGSGRLVLAYRLAAHVAFLLLLWRELIVFPGGNGYVSVAWGIYALVLIVAGLRIHSGRALLYAGIGTLLLVVAKLFLVDLVALDAIWRILLFLGFGALFLVLSYFFQNALRQGVAPPEVEGQMEAESYNIQAVGQPDNYQSQ